MACGSGRERCLRTLEWGLGTCSVIGDKGTATGLRTLGERGDRGERGDGDRRCCCVSAMASRRERTALAASYRDSNNEKNMRKKTWVTHRLWNTFQHEEIFNIWRRICSNLNVQSMTVFSLYLGFTHFFMTLAVCVCFSLLRDLSIISHMS